MLLFSFAALTVIFLFDVVKHREVSNIQHCGSNMSVNEVILSNDSGFVRYRNRPSFIFLSRATLSVCDVRQPGGDPLAEIDLKDVIGARLEPGKPDKRTGVDTYLLSVFAYPPKSKGCCGGSGSSGSGDIIRMRTLITLQFRTSKVIAQNWLYAIDTLTRSGENEVQYTELVADTERVLMAPDPRHFMVVVNPVGGQKLGMKIWKRVVQPMLQEANIEVHLLITEYANHARDVLTETDLSIFETVLCIGGDGMVYEVINGIIAGAESADGSVTEAAVERLQQVNLAHIPGGTGNGLAKSVLFASHEAYTPLNAVFVAIKGSPHPLDISMISNLISSHADGSVDADASLLHGSQDGAVEGKGQLQQGQSHLSFLSLEWGLVSDVDILSESMRCLGELRMTLAGLYYIMKRRYYPGRLRMRLAPPKSASANSESTDAKANSKDVKLSKSDGSSVSEVPNPVSNSSNEVIEDACASAQDNWVTIEGDFLMVWVVQTSHAAGSIHSGPGVLLDDGIFTIFVVQRISRASLLNLLLVMDSGNHVHHPLVQVYRCYEYFLEPLTEKGIIAVDGEVIPYGPIHATMLPGAARVLTL